MNNKDNKDIKDNNDNKDKKENNPNFIAKDILEKLKNVLLLEFFPNNKKMEKYREINKTIKSKDILVNKKFSLNLWDSNEEFYINLKKYFNSLLFDLTFSEEIKILPKSSFVKNGILCLINIMLLILNKVDNAYENKKIKFNINTLIELLSGKSKTILNNISFYRQSVEELKIEYKTIIEFDENNYEEIKKLNKIMKDKALDKLKLVKNHLNKNIRHIFSVSYLEMIDSITYDKNNINMEEYNSKFDKLDTILYTFNQYCEKYTNIEELINKCKNNEDICNILSYGISKLLETKKIKINKGQKYVLDNIIFQLGLFEIDLNSQENLNIIYDIEYSEYVIKENFNEYEKAFYYQYLLKKEEIQESKKSKNYENEINTLINDNKFLKEFFSILSSPYVSLFLKGKRKYIEKEQNYETLFIDYDDYNNFPDDDLSRQFEKFIKDIENNYNKFRNLIIIKQLGFKIHGAVDSNMRIFINPSLNSTIEGTNNEEKYGLIKAFLKITLLHELVHFLKFYPINNIIDKFDDNIKKPIPKTPKGKENGQMIIYFLFKKPIILKMKYYQAILINDIQTWYNKDKLKNIFEEDEEINKNHEKEGEISLFMIYDIDKDKKKIRREDDFCIWEPVF